MKETKGTKYYINGSGPYTWKNVLHWCYRNIRSDSKYYDRKDRCYKYEYHSPASSWARIEDFFSNFRHNENDGIWSGGYWKDERVGIEYFDIVGPLLIGENRTKHEYIYEKRWIPFKFTPHSNQVTDNHGRIIPSGYIKDCFLKYIPCDEDKYIIQDNRYLRRNYYRSYRPTYVHERDFRKGPVPSRGGYRKWCGRRYAGDHGEFGNECRSTLGFKAELRDIESEFNVKIKWNRSRASFVKAAHTDWDPLHWHGKGRGWKRTRKEKQWA